MDVNYKVQNFFHTNSYRALVVAELTAFIVAIGWLFSIDTLKSGSPDFLSMRPNIVLGVFLLSLAIRLKLKKTQNIAFYIFCVLISFIGSLSFFDYILSLNSGINQMGFSTPTTNLGQSNPQRMDLVSCAFLMLSGPTLFLNRILSSLYRGTFFVIAGISLISLIGHIYGIRDLQGIRVYAEMGIFTSISFLFIAIAVIFSDIEKMKNTKVLISDGPGGFIARRLIPSSILIMTALGVGKLAGQSLGFFSTRYGTALLSGVAIVVFIIAIVKISSLLEHSRAKTKVAIQKVKKLEYENQLRDRFVQTMSHDLKNPINIVKLHAELIRDFEHENNQVSDLVRTIIKTANRINDMIENLLDAGKIKSGTKLKIEPSFGNLSKTVRSAVSDMAFLYGNRFELDLQSPSEGTWDLSLIRRALENLISNAIKYGSQTESITIHLKIEENTAFIKVHNYGSYIPKNEINDLFSPYGRSNNAVASNTKGWGLGLTLVEGVAQAHNGKIEVQSSQENGTSFQMQLPSQCHVHAARQRVHGTDKALDWGH